MTKRKAYKPLYLASQAAIRVLQDKLTASRLALAEVEQAIIPLGETTLKGVAENGADVIRLQPLQFVAARAFINSHSRIMTDDPKPYADHYAWRGRPIVKGSAPR